MANIIGQDHYENGAIQPIDYIHANDLNFDEGSIVKYVTRHKYKDGDKDIRKIIDYAIFILKDQYLYSNSDICRKVIDPLMHKYTETHE